MTYEKPTPDELVARRAMTNATMAVHGWGLVMQHDEMVAMIVDAIETSRDLDKQASARITRGDAPQPSDAWFVDHYWTVSGDDWAIPERLMVSFGRACFEAGFQSAQPDEGIRLPMSPSRAWVEDGKVFIEAEIPQVAMIKFNDLGAMSISVDETVPLPKLPVTDTAYEVADGERPQTDRDRHRTQGHKTRHSMPKYDAGSELNQ